jgi:selenocysteine lyase/cysteine desulfurase
LLHEGRFRESLASAGRALESLRAVELDQAAFAIHHPAVSAHYPAGIARWFRGQPDQALSLALEARGIAERLGTREESPSGGAPSPSRAGCRNATGGAPDPRCSGGSLVPGGAGAHIGRSPLGRLSVDRREWLVSAGALLAACRAQGVPEDGVAEPAGIGSKADFPLAQARTYLNNAGYHPLSVSATRAARDYLARRTEGSKEPDWEVSAEVKQSFARLINGDPTGVCYVTSTMSGENLVAAGLGIPQGSGNVVTDALHFEGSLYLYGSLERRGVDVRIVRPREWRIELADVEQAVDSRTRLVAVSLVSYLNGFQHDVKALADLVHARGAYLYVDIIQGAGAVPFDVRASGVDFCACATYKWLMGDFGLGFFYVRPELLDTVIPRVQYGWRQFDTFEYHMLPHDEPGPYPASWRTLPGAPGYFEMGTFSRTAEACLSYSLGYIQSLGVDRIQAHHQSLTRRLQQELPRLGFEPLTPPGSTSPIVSFVLQDPATVTARLTRANVEIKVDQHYMRISPSIYNDDGDIDALLNALS